MISRRGFFATLAAAFLAPKMVTYEKLPIGVVHGTTGADMTWSNLQTGAVLSQQSIREATIRDAIRVLETLPDA